MLLPFLAFIKGALIIVFGICMRRLNAFFTKNYNRLVLKISSSCTLAWNRPLNLRGPVQGVYICWALSFAEMFCFHDQRKPSSFVKNLLTTQNKDSISPKVFSEQKKVLSFASFTFIDYRA